MPFRYRKSRFRGSIQQAYALNPDLLLGIRFDPASDFPHHIHAFYHASENRELPFVLRLVLKVDTELGTIACLGGIAGTDRPGKNNSSFRVLESEFTGRRQRRRKVAGRRKFDSGIRPGLAALDLVAIRHLIKHGTIIHASANELLELRDRFRRSHAVQLDDDCSLARLHFGVRRKLICSIDRAVPQRQEREDCQCVMNSHWF